MSLLSITGAIRIISVMSYFAGIFYMVRLFTYHTEVLEKDEPERSILHRRLSSMEERLWNIITIPALTIMSITGIHTFHLMDWIYFLFGWMYVKLLFIGILLWYHYYSWRIIKRLQAGQVTLTSLQLRMFDEVTTLILFMVVFAIMFKALFTAYWYFALLILVVMRTLIMLMAELVNRR